MHDRHETPLDAYGEPYGPGALAATHRQANQEIAALLTSKGGADLMETLRLLNLIATPSIEVLVASWAVSVLVY